MSGAAFYDLCLELIYPSRCHLCGENAELNSPLCQGCLEKIARIGQNRCEICGKAFEGEVEGRLCGDCIRHQPAFDRARAFARYQDPMTDLVHRFKYERGFYFLDWMAEGLTQVYQREFAGENFDLIIPVPLHWLRILKRGYNQALILAKPLRRRLEIPIGAGALIRARNTEAQFGLSAHQRKENIKQSFRVKNEKLIEGKNILLVDDIITTGITLDEAAKTLKKAGAERVCGLALART